MAIKTYTTKSGDDKTKVKNLTGVDFDWEGYKFADIDKLDVGEVITYDDGVTANKDFNLDTLVEGVTPIAPSTAVAPVAKEIGNFVSVGSQVDQQIQPIQATQIDPLDDLNKQATRYQEEITSLEEKLANTSQEKIASQQAMGIYTDVERLNEMKRTLSGVQDKLYTAQDRSIEIPLEQKQVYREAGVTGTQASLSQDTFAERQQNTIDQLASSREYARLGSAIGDYSEAIQTNINLIDQKITADRDQIEFKITQKTQLLDSILTQHSNLLTSKEATALEAQKHEYAKDLIDYKAQSERIKNGASVLAGGGAEGGTIDGYLSSTPDDRTSIAREALLNGEITTKEFLTLQRDNQNDKTAQLEKEDEAREKVATQNSASKSVIYTSDELLNSVNTLLKANTTGDLDDVLGRFDQFDFIATWSDQDKGLVAAIDHIFSEKTVSALSQMKGNPSDKDMEVVERMAQAGFDRSIGDPETLVNILNSMKPRLEDAKIIENAAILNRSEKQTKQTLQDVEENMAEPAPTNVSINVNESTGNIPDSAIISHNRINDTPENYQRQTTFDNFEINSVLDGLANNESKGSGGYQAIGTAVVNNSVYQNQRALGRYQVMPGNLPQWSQEAGFPRAVTPQEFLNSPQIQDMIVATQIDKNITKYGNIKDAVSVHFSGKPYELAKDLRDANGVSVSEYVDKFLANNNLV